MLAFADQIASRGHSLVRGDLLTLQLNVGRKCNQACRHCHVDAAPWRTEMMSGEVSEKVMIWIRAHRPAVVDITGGAPELSDHFKDLVRCARAIGARVIDRNNLTILSEAGFEDLPEFLAQNQVEIIASLPCYLEENVQRQRGHGVFDRSIAGLRKLNALGYGSQIALHLVYNPIEPALPPPQPALEADYKEALGRQFGITFNKLLTITNQPIARFAENLRKSGKWNEYLELLVNSFNTQTLDGLMCRSTLNVGYDGQLYDCDFNQMLGMNLSGSSYLWEITPGDLVGLPIRTGIHCYACTAGHGSSCSGALA